MSREQILHEIETRFPSRRAFVSAFNQAAGFEALHETTLSRQLSGNLGGDNVHEINFCGEAYFFFKDESKFIADLKSSITYSDEEEQ